MLVLLPLVFMACGGSKNDSPKVIKEIVCGDSVEQELYDQEGNVFTSRIPGKCDTIFESE